MESFICLGFDSRTTMTEMPSEFTERLKRIVPPHLLTTVFTSFSQPKLISFRINHLAGEVMETLAELKRLALPLEPIPWLVDQTGGVIGWTTEASFKSVLTHSSLADSGRIYLQNLSSMLAPLVLDARPGECVLDLAAAPGGKTIQLAQQMQNRGNLSAVEAIGKRMYKLQANLKRCGVTICKTYLTDGRTVGNKTPARFDRVLLDAPCSSEARMRSDDPQSWETWSLRKLRETSRKQTGLLKAAVHATKPGGTILYCTCSFAPEENEQVVDRVLRKFAGCVNLVPIDLPIENIQSGLTEFEGKPFDSSLAKTIRILPDNRTDAFFMAKLIRIK